MNTAQELYCSNCGARMITGGIKGAEHFGASIMYTGYGGYNEGGDRLLREYVVCPNKRKAGLFFGRKKYMSCDYYAIGEVIIQKRGVDKNGE